MEYSKVGIKDIFKGIIEFFKQKVEEENNDLEKQIAEIQAAEDSKNIEQLETEVEKHEPEKTKKRRSNNLSRKQITKKEENIVRKLAEQEKIQEQKQGQDREL